MAYLSKKKYDTQLERINRDNLSKARKRRLREERKKYSPKFKFPSTSKIVLIVAALFCIEILIFCQYMIFVTGDTNALYAMVGTLVSFVPIIIGYYVKSTKENTSGGITYETIMADIQSMQNENSRNENNNTEAVG